MTLSPAPDQSYRNHTDWRVGSTIAGGTAAATSLFLYVSSLGLAAATSALAAFHLDPANHQQGSLPLKLRLRAAVITNAVAPATNFTMHLYPVATWGGASGANPTIATVGASVANVPINTPAAGGPSPVGVSADFDFPAAGWYCLACVNSGATAANSTVIPMAQLQRRLRLI